VKPTRGLDSYFDDISVSRGADGGAKKQRGTRRRERDNSQPALPGQAAHRYRSVRVDRIIDPERDRKLDHDHVCAIAESAEIIGFLHPIAVRSVEIKKGSKVRTKTVLVAGALRLEAARFLDRDRIDCIYVDGDETFVQLVQIGEDLFRKQITVLRRSELLAQWYDLISKDFSGQVGQKSKLGRPPGGVSRAARNLPIGRSEQARRKIIRRGRMIARLRPQTKVAVISAGLDDNQQALLTIAKCQGRRAQLNKVALLAPSSKGQNDTDAERATDGKDNDGEAAAEKSRKGRDHSASTSHPETAFEQLEEFWQKEGRKLWMYAPFSEREKFHGMLRRARCKARTDVVKFVRDVFEGRGEVFAKNLYDLAKRRGFSKQPIRAVLKQLCFHRTRSRRRPHSGWRYLNPNQNWKNEIPAISRPELLDIHEPEVSDEPAGRSMPVKTNNPNKTSSKTSLLDDLDYYKF
jgi:ParB-like chromosome segregation protein Spo0J